MTNHSFVTTKGNVKPSTITAFVEHMVNEKFGSNATMSKSDDDKWLEIHFRDDNGKYIGSLDISILSQRKISFRQGACEFSSFLQYWFANTIGMQFKGIRSDEGIEETWKPEIKAKNYIEWLDFKEREAKKMVLSSPNISKSDKNDFIKHRKHTRKLMLKIVPRGLHKL